MRGHIKQRSPGSWSLIISQGKDRNTGKQKYKWVTYRGTKKEAEKELARLWSEMGGTMPSGEATIR